MEIILAFDYNKLDTETRIVVQQRTGELKNLMRATAQNLADIGQRLIEVRDKLRHDKSGGFEGWLNTEFGWSRQTAYNYIRVYEQFGNCKTVLQLDIDPSAMYLLASPSIPMETRQELIEEAEQGKRITKKEVKARITRGGIDTTVQPQVTDTSPVGYSKAKSTYSKPKSSVTVESQVVHFNDFSQAEDYDVTGEPVKRVKEFTKDELVEMLGEFDDFKVCPYCGK